MKNVFFSLIFLLTSLFSYTGLNSQNLSPQVQREVDSLRRELKMAKHDTEKVKLRYEIAGLSMVTRISFWDSLISDAEKHKMDLIKCISLSNKFYLYEFVHYDKTGKAIIYLNQALRLAERIKYKEGMIAMLMNMSNYYSKKGDTKQTLSSSYKGLRIAEESKDKNGTAAFYSIIATCNFSMGRPDKALISHLNCLKIFTEIHSEIQIAATLMSVGSDYLALKDTDNCVNHYLRLKQYITKVGVGGISIGVLNSIGAAYGLINQTDSAFKYTKLSYEMALRTKSALLKSSTSASMAKLTFKKGDSNEADRIVSKGLSYAKPTGSWLHIAELAILKKQISTKLGKYKEALAATDLYMQAKDSLQSETNKKQILETEFNYNLEKKESENKLLAQQNQIQNLQLGQSRYFIFGLLAVALLILVIAYLIVRQNKLNNQHQKMYLEQKLISSQMNPHFVFNSLNAIQHLIMTKQNDKAEIYLSKFANLIRELLESNTKESLTLKEEVGILNGFLEMESRRFGKSFNYHVIVEEGIDTHKINIPHMLVQPFIENAIWHGLLAKEGERNLAVTFTSNTDKTILCVVQDNGIGREASQKKQSTFKKKSLALSFVKQRLELLSETLKIKCSVEIVDMVGEMGEALGTKVNIVLPLLT